MKWRFHRPDKPRLVVDVETYSEVDLRLAGPHAYAEHHSTGVHCLAWEIKGGHHPGKGLWLPGMPIPSSVHDHIARRRGPVIAHNWLFEWCIYQRVLVTQHGWPFADMELWSCTMARALYHGLPASLELLSEALELNNPKDASMRRKMLMLARPRTRHVDGSAATWWHHDTTRGPGLLRDLYDYCIKDVAAESEADDKLPELPDDERETFFWDARVNLRGVRVDEKLVEGLDHVTQDELASLGQAINLATSGAVRSVNQVAALLRWIQLKTGINLPSLAKEHLPAALEATRGTIAHFPIQARAEGAKASTAKLKAMRGAVSHDGRARLLLQYYGAGRTGRWAGRRVQPQNMPRPLLKGAEVDTAIRWALQGRGADEFRTFFAPSVMGTVSSCLRGCLVAEPGKLLVSVDLAQIEARMIAWLAGQRDILDVFARGDDVYTYAARKIGSNDRTLGKVVTLALGFGMGGPKFAHTAKGYGITLDEETAKGLVYDWRDANSAIVTFWSELGEAFKEVVRASSGHWLRLGALQLGKTGKAVRIRLPSGRDLVYQAADIGRDDKGRDEIGYWGVHQLSNRWTRLRTYGGKLAENITQAAARDVLRDALRRCEAQGLQTILTVHDEGLFESPETRAYADLNVALLEFRRTPTWAPGLVVGAEGWVGARYKKG